MVKINKKYFFILILFSFILFTACTSATTSSHQPTLSSVEAGPILLYDDSVSCLVLYDTDKKEIAQDEIAQDTVQYAFNEHDSILFSSSSTLKSNFSILKAENDNWETLYTMPESTAIYPLAKKNDIYYFFKSKSLDISGQEVLNKSNVVLFNMQTNTLESIGALNGIDILSGAFIAPYLYFTDYNSVSNTYRLYRFDTELEDAMPEIIEQNLKNQDIYSDGKNIWLSSKTSLYYKNKVFSKSDLNYFYKNYLIQMAQTDTGYSLNITNINKDALLYTFDAAFNFELEEENVTIYGDHFIEQRILS